MHPLLIQMGRVVSGTPLIFKGVLYSNKPSACRPPSAMGDRVNGAFSEGWISEYPVAQLKLQ